MDLRRLRSFVVLAETLHFGRAADRLHVAQPALTQQIQHLERELGVRLFDRGPRSVRLTPVGREFLVEARKALAQVERATLVAARAQRGEVGQVEISYVSSTAYSGVLPQLLVAFEEIAPDVSVGLTEADLEAQMTFVEEGRVDAALVRLPAGTLADGLDTLTLRRERVVACLRSDHPLAKRSVPVAALAGEPFLATHLRAGYGFYDTALRICHAAGFEPAIVSRSHQFATIVSLVAAGRGVALVPEAVSRLALPGVVYAELETCPFTSDIAIAYRAKDNSAATGRFLALCVEFASHSTPSPTTVRGQRTR